MRKCPEPFSAINALVSATEIHRTSAPIQHEVRSHCSNHGRSHLLPDVVQYEKEAVSVTEKSLKFLELKDIEFGWQELK
ncbi:hypothetical protein C0J52_15316 [Blattella germanica]|nr:hypothetical protein C0J52_15316 [Blattella germanica]